MPEKLKALKGAGGIPMLTPAQAGPECLAAAHGHTGMHLLCMCRCAWREALLL